MTRPWALAGALGGAVLICDQVSKAVIEDRLVPGEQVDVLGPLSLTYSHNDGVAFGLAGGGGVLLVVLTLVALGVLAWWFRRHVADRGAWVAAGLITGGALGNLADRIASGSVTDFIDVSAWPPFNVADIAITTGVALFVYLLLQEPSAEPASPAP